jgi:hypothetical protein
MGEEENNLREVAFSPGWGIMEEKKSKEDVYEKLPTAFDSPRDDRVQ